MSSTPYLTGEDLISYLRGRFNGADAITPTELRSFLGICYVTEIDMCEAGCYPRTIRLSKSVRILISDLAAWIEQGGAKNIPARMPRKGAAPARKFFLKEIPGAPDLAESPDAALEFYKDQVEAALSMGIRDRQIWLGLRRSGYTRSVPTFRARLHRLLTSGGQAPLDSTP